MEQFDVFISFKNSDAAGTRTEDSYVAERLYKALSSRGINVFYSNVSLLKLGESVYKRSIDQALDSAKVLVVIATEILHIESRWIQYEWESFHTDILNGIKKNAEIVTYTSHISPHDLPRPLRSYQSCAIDEMDVNSFASFVANVVDKLTAFDSPIRAGASTDEGDFTSSATAGFGVPKAGGEPFLPRHEKSAYSSSYNDEFARLRIQAGNAAASDEMAIGFLRNKGALHPGSVVLDVGCAYGFVAADRFGKADWVDKIIGIDVNAEVIEKARELNSNPKMVFETADVESRDFKRRLSEILAANNVDRIDVIYSALVLHHLKNPNRVLRVLRRFMADDGYIVLRGSDDGSKLCYPNSELMDQIIAKSLTVTGVSDRLNGRKLFTQLADSGYHEIHSFSNMRDLSNLSYSRREDLFRESFSYRLDYFKKAFERDPYNMQAKSDYEWMREALDLFEDQFFERNFWYCEYDYMAVASK